MSSRFKKLIPFLLFVPLLIFVMAAALVPQTPITRLLLQNDGDGGGNSFTNLKNLQATGTVFAAHYGGAGTNDFAVAGQTPWLSHINAAGFALSNVTRINATNLDIRGLSDFQGNVLTNATTIYGTSNQTMTIQSGSTGVLSNAAPTLNIIAGNATNTGGTGGALNVFSGSAQATNSRAGLLQIASGSGQVGGASGGDAYFIAGAGFNNGGSVHIVGGSSAGIPAAGTAGNIYLHAGTQAGGRQGIVYHGFRSGTDMSTNNFPAPTRFEQWITFAPDTNQPIGGFYSNNFFALFTNTAQLAIGTNNAGTNSLKVIGNGDFSSISINGQNIGFGAGSNSVVQGLYSYPLSTVPAASALLWYLQFAFVGDNIRIPLTNSAANLGVTFVVPISAWVTTSSSQIEKHDFYLVNYGITNIPITFGASDQNWIWMSEHGVLSTPNDLASNELLIVSIRHRGSNTNILASYLYVTNASRADY